MRANSYFRFTNDTQFYPIGSIKPVMLVYDYVVDGKDLIINEDVGINLFHGDTLTVSYKEFEILSLIQITKAGTGYRKGDSIAAAGQASVDVDTGFSLGSNFGVKEVGPNGEVTAIEMISPGLYITINPANQFTGGNGSGFEALLDVKATTQRKLVERMLEQTVTDGSKTRLIIQPKMPDGVTEGKVSVEKWEMLLTSNYVGPTIIGSTYEVGRDFTPNVGLPLMPSYPVNPSPAYNLAMTILDRKIAELQSQIDALKQG